MNTNQFTKYVNTINRPLFAWQPQWKAAQGMKVKLAAGTPMRKKTVIALARRLAIDLWRWRTGRCSMADLGWTQA
jgi:hypothetical protein